MPITTRRRPIRRAISMFPCMVGRGCRLPDLVEAVAEQRERVGGDFERRGHVAVFLLAVNNCVLGLHDGSTRLAQMR